ncbi:hypothetical protein D9758_000544 [Tetrapyrgos nigripes]|uniref:F-box domain-containing protein n=1 Tax=Tetrapyrgos nigripes TaxID=182062 RepID=A0A8H5H258_9AGAR|nr:hypothetical protein D9758_000544 [Tetrapyrgos nigripes]
MSSTHGRDDPDPELEEAFFQFDPFEPLSSSALPSSLRSVEPEAPYKAVTITHDDSISHSTYDMMHPRTDILGKGKAVSRPVPILIAQVDHTEFDDFGSPTWSASSSYHNDPGTPGISSTPSSPSFTLGSFSSVWQASETASVDGFTDAAERSSGKGKGRDTDVPSIPPLTFSPSGFEPMQSGESSISYTHASPSSNAPFHEPLVSSSTGISASPTLRSPMRPAPSRRHSYTASPTHTKRHSITSRFKGKLTSSNKLPGDIARRLLSRKLASPPRVAGAIAASPSIGHQPPILDPFPVSFHEELSPSQDFLSASDDAVFAQTFLKAKGRSNSSPLPLSALDFIPSSSEDVFVPVPLVFRNYFDELLPREIQLQVLTSLVALHEGEHLRQLCRGSWTVMKAASSRNRWVGKEKAVCELVKLSRVSKTWRDLVFDGQLWNDLCLRVLPSMRPSQVLAISDIGGRFATSLNLSGHVHLDHNILSSITDKLSLPNPSLSLAAPPFTQLTTVNLRGCISLTTQALHHLLVRSPALERLYLKGLSVVTNTICDILAMYCPRITVLDLSRCPNMDAEGIRRLASAFTARGECLKLKELRLAALKNVDDKMMMKLGEAAPFLEVLDLSYSRKLHNSALDAFVACEGLEEQRGAIDTETVQLAANELGRDPSDSNRYRRRVTQLRHLSLSSCALLTDQGCSNLAHSVPRLELLELAGIGEELRDDGLVRLLNTTPLIRKLDLEEAYEITDSVLAAITPSTAEDLAAVPDPLVPTKKTKKAAEPGHALEHLVISYASNLTDEALSNVVRRCPRLTVLEADNTRIGASVLREFVSLSTSRKLINPKIVAVDCRLIHDSLVRELTPTTRPRMGLRTWDTRKLRYLDGRDFGAASPNLQEDDDSGKDDYRDAIMKVAHGQDELDEKRVVLKTFYSWQSVDAVWAARDKRRKSSTRRKLNESSGSTETESEELGGGRTRWWSPGGRRSRPGSGSNSPPAFPELNLDGQCVIM